MTQTNAGISRFLKEGSTAIRPTVLQAGRHSAQNSFIALFIKINKTNDTTHGSKNSQCIVKGIKIPTALYSCSGVGKIKQPKNGTAGIYIHLN